jgi:hypothetical protein
MHHSSKDEYLRYPSIASLAERDPHWSTFHQTSSPSVFQRHDSLPYSSTVQLGLSSSPRQAEQQPRSRIMQNLPTSGDYTQLPVNNCMTKSMPQYSPMSSSQYAHNYNTHRASSGSLGGASTSYTARSDSRMPENLENASQQRSAQSHLLPADWHASQSSRFLPDASHQRIATTAPSPYEFDLAEIMGGGSVGAHENRAQSLDLTAYTHE